MNSLETIPPTILEISIDEEDLTVMVITSTTNSKIPVAVRANEDIDIIKNINSNKVHHMIIECHSTDCLSYLNLI